MRYNGCRTRSRRAGTSNETKTSTTDAREVVGKKIKLSKDAGMSQVDRIAGYSEFKEHW